MSLSGHALRSGHCRVLARGTACVGVTEARPRDPDPCGRVLWALHSTPMGFLNTSAFRRFAADTMQKVNLFETRQMFCDVYCLEPGQSQKVHAHAGATKFYYVIEGEGTFTIGDATRTLGPGGIAWSAPAEAHGVENRGDVQLVVLVSMAPNPNFP